MKPRAHPFHPILFALFPILFLYARNIREFGISETFLPAAQAVGIAAAVWAGGWVLFRSVRKGALAATLVVVPLFSFNSIVELMPESRVDIGITVLSTLHFLAFGMFCAVAAGMAGIVIAEREPVGLTRILNFTAVCLVALPAVNIAIYETRYAGRVSQPQAVQSPPVSVAESVQRPSVFYIIADGYARADMLAKVYGFDNSAFVQSLRERGFYVADKARTNYSHTRFSLASTLNMEYLDGLAAGVGIDYADYGPVEAMLAQNKVVDTFETIGYRFFPFGTGFSATTFTDSPNLMRARAVKSEFASGVANAIAPTTDEKKSARDRLRILFPFEKMGTLAQTDRPRFVFAHIIAPHPPYVFNREGGPADIDRYYDGMASANHLVKPGGLTRAKSMQLYIDQLIFMNNRLIGLIDVLISNSGGKAVIIIQGDHGPCCFMNHDALEKTYLEDRMSILLAVRFPGAGEGELYETMTPVNVFRTLFRSHFKLDYPNLPDRSFYSTVGRPYRFIDVTSEIGSDADIKRYEWLKGQDYYGDENAPGATPSAQ